MNVLLIGAYVLLLFIMQLHVLQTDRSFCLLELNFILKYKIIYFYFINLFYIGKEILTVATEEDLDLKDEIIVTKIGTATETTCGRLTDDSLSVDPEISGINFECYNCYAIEKIKINDDPFFLEGDSGSGVYVIDKDTRKPIKALGIAFAFTKRQTAVCNIGTIVDELDLQIVRYFDKHKDESTSSETLNISTGKTEEKTKEPKSVS